MNKLTLKRILSVIFILSIIASKGNAQIFHKNPEKQLFGKTHMKNKEPKVKQPRSVLKAKKKQEANERRLKKESAKAVKRSQKRSIEIQSPEVQERMKQNKRDYTIRDKNKHKKVKSGAKKARKKYD